MTDQPRPRRPAILEQPEAELIEGDHDTAESSELAHDTAQVVLGHPDAPDDLALRIRTAIDEEGLDSVAGLWSRSPAATLPGTLWRLYLLLDWIERDPETVDARYGEGDPGDVPDPQTLAQEIGHLLAGREPDSVAGITARAADLFDVLARGAAAHHQTSQTASHAPATEPAVEGTQGLEATARELRHAAELARRGMLN
ncbi:MAG TPA: hypothetical protein VK024_09505 [Actinomycetaceae bacterium]|nr:hypothetical protein [Actinomycetaceae bacterium]